MVFSHRNWRFNNVETVHGEMCEQSHFHYRVKQIHLLRTIIRDVPMSEIAILAMFNNIIMGIKAIKSI